MEVLTKEIYKSALHAQTKLDYQLLVYKEPYLLDATVEEEKEKLTLTYDVTGMMPMKNIREEKRRMRLAIMLQALKLSSLTDRYVFEMTPDNLYYDRNGNVYAAFRDIPDRESLVKQRQERFMQEYKALLGYAVQKRYGYMNYLEGGEDLYQKNTLLKQAASVAAPEELQSILEQEYEQISRIEKKTRTEVVKSHYLGLRIYLAVSAVVFLLAGGYTVYNELYLKAEIKAKLAAGNDFMDKEYRAVIEDLRSVSVEHMDKHQKYMLATCYVKSENLTIEQKENILTEVTLDGDEKIKEYWIYIGRLDVQKAEDIAMVKSNDELLLYAYLKEKTLLETNTDISGEEKAARLETLDRKIESLVKEYETEEE
ncbi:MAG: type VII secretion protein EssB/YukC [Lachnospiraceae bacterium]